MFYRKRVKPPGDTLATCPNSDRRMDEPDDKNSVMPASQTTLIDRHDFDTFCIKQNVTIKKSLE